MFLLVLHNKAGLKSKCCPWWFCIIVYRRIHVGFKGPESVYGSVHSELLIYFFGHCSLSPCMNSRCHVHSWKWYIRKRVRWGPPFLKCRCRVWPAANVQDRAEHVLSSGRRFFPSHFSAMWDLSVFTVKQNPVF